MRLATVGCQKEQKHFICSKIFIVVAFDPFGWSRIYQILVFLIQWIVLACQSLEVASQHIAS